MMMNLCHQAPCVNRACGRVGLTTIIDSLANFVTLRVAAREGARETETGRHARTKTGTESGFYRTHVTESFMTRVGI